ncbi:hypothetical protein BJX61DRAFT_519741 [Aspergillus egyptiacus]|nr:hypothetical protein BJX61DRAFT_519741 [Aspergillus egyptiacus]
MPIVALPPSTARAIGSTSIIADPCSITKELLDNALDSSASAVAIEISSDTVSLIQVKDNGHGIPSDDYSLVCKRAFTSKIHTVNDLRNVGGKSLGFRGEALASAAEVSGGLAIVTRVAAEPVGSSLKYGRNGELISTEPISHPVGTTVRISDLFKHIPVRRQTAAKNSKKAISKIRKMIQAYAMARPTTRLTFKVVKAKSEGSNWMYAPSKNATLVEAALKVAGTEIASNCVRKEWPMRLESSDQQGDSSSDLRIVALLPKPCSDFTKFNNAGQYISIDGRPISAARGIAQDITKIYRSYLRSVTSRHDPLPTITDPFICLHMSCPEGSYDVNVEPSKDDVLFEDSQTIIYLVEDLLRDSYGEMSGTDASECPSPKQDAVYLRNGFEALLAKAPNGSVRPIHPRHIDLQFEDSVSAHSFARPESIRASPSVSKSTFELHAGGSRPIISSGMRTSNTEAVIDTTDQHQAGRWRNSSVITRIYPRERRDSQADHEIPGLATQAESIGTCLPSPVSSMGSPPSNTTTRSPLYSRTSLSALNTSHTSPLAPVRNFSREERERDRVRYGKGSLDTWFVKLSQASETPQATVDPLEEDSVPSLSQLSQQRFGVEGLRRNGASDAGSSHAQLANTSPRSSSQSQLSQSPPNIPKRIASTISKRQDVPVLEQWSARLYNASSPDQNPDLQKALEFENRKKAAIQVWRTQLRSAVSSGNANSPHRSRYLAARAALNSEPVPATQDSGSDSTCSQPPNPVLSPHDPRAYLMRSHAQQVDGQNKSTINRITTSKLPFEKIPDGDDLHNVNLKLPAELSSINASFRNTCQIDLYAKSTAQIEAFTSLSDISDLEFYSSRLSALTRAHYKLADSLIYRNFSSIFQL